MPGDADTVPGVTPVLIGVGADGLSTYDVGGGVYASISCAFSVFCVETKLIP